MRAVEQPEEAGGRGALAAGEPRATRRSRALRSAPRGGRPRAALHGCTSATSLTSLPSIYLVIYVLVLYNSNELPEHIGRQVPLCIGLIVTIQEY